MFRMLPVTPTSKVLPKTNNGNNTLRKITEKYVLFENTIEANISKYAKVIIIIIIIIIITF